MKNKSQLKIGIILSYIHMGLTMIVQLVYTPVMIRMLGKSEYGLYNLVGSVVSYLSLFSLGFTGAYMRFHERAKKDDRDNNKKNNSVARLNGMFISLFMLMAFVAFSCGMILAQFPREIFGSNLSNSELLKAKQLMYILVINIALTFPSSIFDSMVSSREKFLFQRVVALVSVIFNPLVCLPLLFKGYGSVAVVAVTTLITFLRLIVNIYYCLRKLKIEFEFKNFDFGILKEIAVFSGFLFMNMIVDQINWSIDKFILGRVSGTNDVAMYGVGAQINSFVVSFSTAISSVFSPRVNRIAVNSEDRHSEYTKLFIKVGRIQCMVVGLAVSGFVFFGKKFILNIYAGEGYDVSYYVALLLILPVFVPLIQNLGIEIQRAENKHKIRSILYFFMALVNAFISYYLAKAFGPVGTAAGTALSLVLVNGIVMNIYYYKGLKINIIKFWLNILKIFRSMIIPIIYGIVIMYKMDTYKPVWYLLSIVVYTILYISSLYLFGMNESEKNIIKGVKNKFFGGKIKCRE